jgi:predicted RNA binding protein YcfA (HicA-like mRNA interferase family)
LVRLKVFSGKQVCAILARHGFEEVRRRGSHIIMQKKSPIGTITVPVPNHDEIRIEPCSPSSGNPASIELNSSSLTWRQLPSGISRTSQSNPLNSLNGAFGFKCSNGENVPYNPASMVLNFSL